MGFNLNHLAYILMYGGADYWWHSCSKGVNIKCIDESLALNETCADTKYHVYLYCVQREKEEVSLRHLHVYNVSVVLRQSNKWL